MRKSFIFITTFILIFALFSFSVSAVNGVSNHSGTPEMRGVWIATVSNINFPSQAGLSEQSLKQELEKIVENCVSVGLNTVFFQVRPCADALYNSDIFPTSAYLSGTQGVAADNGFDPLAYMIDICHQNGIALHAWVNPYRVTAQNTELSSLADNNPAKLHPEYTVKYADGKIYFNPGLAQVRKLVVDGVTELVTLYPQLDGIHFDDYFYPYPYSGEEFNDKETYSLYGGEMSLADWRRNNVNLLIEETYTAIKSINPDCRFGVSPFGIWANEASDTPVKGSATNGLESYVSLYCDPVYWANKGIVDYITPQVYWQFTTSASAFDTVCRWWNANLDGTDVDLYIGHAAYKTKDFSKNELAEQVEFARQLLKYKGSIFYGYEDIIKNTASVKDGLQRIFKEPIFYSDPVSTGEKPQINYPENGTKQSVSSTYLLGSSDPAFPVVYAGNKISRTKDGYFSLFSDLNYGKNYFTLEQNGKSETFTYNCTLKRNAAPDGFETLSSFLIDDCTPSRAQSFDYGEVIEFTCTAPSGCKVTAVIGGMSADLKPTLNAPLSEDGVYYKEIYKGSVKPGKFATQTQSSVLGTLKFRAVMGEKSVTKTIGLITQNPLSSISPTPEPDVSSPVSYEGGYAEVIKDYSHLKISSESSFYNDYRPVNSGMRDYIIDSKDNFLKLRFGGWVNADNAKMVQNSKLFDNRLLFATVKVNIQNTISRSKNTTDLILGVLENVPTNVNVKDNKLVFTLYNTQTSYIPEIKVPANPVISSVSATASGKDTVVFTVTLKNKENYYGFDVKYESGTIVLKINNPVSLNKNGLPLAGKTIVVDAGHGGSDVGALGPSDVKTGLHEADLNLSIALELERALDEYGATVIMTRSEDTTVELLKRVDILAEEYPDMAISVHHNSLAQTSNPLRVHGFLGLYTDDCGYLLTKAVSETVSTLLSRNERSFYKENLAVTRNHRFPSMLCEMSYLTCPEEFQWILSEENVKKSGEAIADGIIEYYKAQEKYLEY